MGGDKMGLSDTEMMSLVRKWRMANPNIVDMWKEIDEASKEAVRFHRAVMCTSKNVIFDGEFMTIELPVGRKLFYYKPEFKDKKIGRSTVPIRSLCYRGIDQTTKQWISIDTYGR